MIGKYQTKSVEETKLLAAELEKSIPIGSKMALIGGLGAGKTAFTQGFAQAMGIDEAVGSPTFKLISEYSGTDKFLYHIDCYRLENAQQFINIGGEEYLSSDRGITIIEWADIIDEILPPGTIIINLSRIPNQTDFREIEIKIKS